MAKTATTDETTTAAPQQAPASHPLVAPPPLRLPYPQSMVNMGVSKDDWQVLVDVIFPLARTWIAVALAVKYCTSRKLDIFKKMVHIVPMRRKTADDKWETVDTIWPGIAEVRTTAVRTSEYAGKDEAIFGPMKTRTFQHVDDRDNSVKKQLTMEFPEWCRVDVYKIVKGVRCKFAGPTVYWEEAYATESSYSDIPNEMWRDRRHGQLEKCAEGGSLRAAFPEELGGEYTAEEMEGRVLHAHQVSKDHFATDEAGQEIMTPTRPKESDFKAPDKPKDVVDVEPEPQGRPVDDGRPEPPPIGEPVIPEHLRRERVDIGQQPAPDTVSELPPNKVGPIKPMKQELDVATAVQANPRFEAAREWLHSAAKGIQIEEDLDAFKRQGRQVLDSFAGVDEEEKDVLRGEFMQLVLAEQKRRAARKK